MGNKNLSNCSNYLYCLKQDKESSSVNSNSHINLQNLTTIQPSCTEEGKKSFSFTMRKSSNLNKNTENLKQSNTSKNKIISKKRQLFIQTDEDVSKEIQEEPIMMNRNTTNKSIEEQIKTPSVQNINKSTINVQNNSNINSMQSSNNPNNPATSININLNNQYVINYYNDLKPQNEKEKASMDTINKNDKANINNINEALYKIKSNNIESYSQRGNKAPVNNNKLCAKITNSSNKYSDVSNSKTLCELNFSSDYQIKMKEEDRIRLYTYISTVKKLQKAVRLYLAKCNFNYESKTSINNISFILKEDKGFKIPPEIFKGNSVSNDRKFSNPQHQSLVNEAMPNINVTKISNESKNNSSNININANVASSLDCKFYKLKSDNKLIKKIKKFIMNNIYYDKSIVSNIFGVKEYSNESKIIGLFNESNEADGIAAYHCQKNNVYLGYFKKNYLNGFGFSKGFSDCCYLGEWQNSKQQGLGIEIWNNGSLYKGEFKLGKKHGIGTYIWKNGSTYTGSWEKNKMHGYGVLKFETGNVFFGNFKNGSMHGFGDFIWTSGKSYSGNYNKDLKEGIGMFYWNNPFEIYLGYWLKGQRDGPAMQITANTKFYSLWENGKQIKTFTSKTDAHAFIINNTNPAYKKYKSFYSLDLEDLVKKYSKKLYY